MGFEGFDVGCWRLCCVKVVLDRREIGKAETFDVA
jgi:hypothetical protein